MDRKRINIVKIALRFTCFLIYLSLKLKPTNIYHRIRQSVSNFDYQQLHEYEKYYKLKLKAELDLHFLNTCWKFNLNPNFLQYRTSITNFTTSKVYKISKRKALLFEIKSKSYKINKLKKVLPINKQYLLFQFRSVNSLELFNEWQIKFHKRMTHFRNYVSQRHQIKLREIGYSIDTTRRVFNFSSYVLNSTERELLEKGPSFVPTPKMDRNHILDHKTETELFYNRLPKSCTNENNYKKLSEDLKISSEILFRNVRKCAENNLMTDENEALNRLKCQKSLIITKSDKVSKFVILDKRDYINSAQRFIQANNYIHSNGDNNLKCYNAIKYQINKMKDILNETERDQMLPNGNRTPILYFLPKIHKEKPFHQLKLRPIVSFYNSYSYNCGKFLGMKIENILENKFRVKDSFDFVQKILSFQPDFIKNNDVTLLTLDVNNLYPSLPVKEIIPQLSEDLSKQFKFPAENLEKLMELCLIKPSFRFYEEYFTQPKGVAMGSPMSPAFSEYFMQKLESKFVPDYNDILFYCRYVDDVFIILKSTSNIQNILDRMNSWHSDITFVIAGVNKTRINFLDIDVIQNGNHFETTIYRKIQHPLKFTEFNSWSPRKFKSNLITSLLYRANKICSTEKLYQEEKQCLEKCLQNSGYTINSSRNIIKHGEQHISKLKFFGPLERPIYFGIDYFGKNSKTFENDVRFIFNKVKPNGSKLVFYHKKEKNLANIFSTNYKHFGNDNGKSGVYKISCLDCDKSYIGQTGRSFAIRLNEHKLFKGEKGKYATFDHITQFHHNLDFVNSHIIKTEYRNDRRLIFESLLMKDHKLFDNNTCSKSLNVF